MMERISNCPNNRQEIKELISDFRDVLKASMLVLCTIGRKPIVLIHGRIIHPGAMNKGIYYSLARE
jgi:hypothetical protein